MSHATHRLSVYAVHRSRPVPTSVSHQSSSLTAARLVLGAARAVGDAQECGIAAFTSATRLYEDCHWEFAFDRLAILADQGHAPAAKLALLMLRYGRSLYGTRFNAKPEQVAYWAQRVLRAGFRPATSPGSVTAIP